MQIFQLWFNTKYSLAKIEPLSSYETPDLSYQKTNRIMIEYLNYDRIEQ